MRDKNAEYKYLTVDSLMRDMSIMVANAAQYNGANSDIAKQAQKLYRHLETSLTHDRRHLGNLILPFTLIRTLILTVISLP